MKNLFSIDGKIAIVTGGSRGIGEMIAAGYLANGAKVYISSRKADVCFTTAKSLADEFGGECIPIPADLSNLDGILSFVEEFSKYESSLDILVNNAGMQHRAPLESFEADVFDQMIAVNLKAPFYTAKALSAFMICLLYTSDAADE